MRFLGIIIARCDSSRLPGKVLIDLGNEHRMIDLVHERLSRSFELSAVALATTDRPIDDELARHAKEQLGLTVYRGQTEDVAARTLACADADGADYFVRLNADSPFVDPALIDQGIRLARVSGADLVTNLVPRSYPYGVSVEVFRTDTYRKVITEFDSANREHVSQFFYLHPERFFIESLPVSADPSLAAVRLTVDDLEDLHRVREIVLKLGPEARIAGYERISKVAREGEASIGTTPRD